MDRNTLKTPLNIRTLSEHEETFHPETVYNYLLSQDYIIARMYELVHDRLDKKNVETYTRGIRRVCLTVDGR